MLEFKRTLIQRQWQERKEAGLNLTLPNVNLNHPVSPHDLTSLKRSNPTLEKFYCAIETKILLSILHIFPVDVFLNLEI